MARPFNILLQTTIPAIEDDWCIERFSLLREYLESLRGADGAPLFTVTARNLESRDGSGDPVLSDLGNSRFDELWLFAVDTGDGITEEDCAGITAFRRRGGGVLTTRDHEDLGSSLCSLAGIGAAHFFHSRQPEPDPARHTVDDPYTTTISWPNYHSGANGDYQRIAPAAGAHELLRNPDAPGGSIEYLPAHPHEGAVGIPAGEEHAAKVVAIGHSIVTGVPFNLAVAFERTADESGAMLGRGVADSSFHHFVDYNWNPALGAPSFVTEPPGDGILRDRRAMEDTLAYVRNLATWLAPEQV